MASTSSWVVSCGRCGVHPAGPSGRVRRSPCRASVRRRAEEPESLRWSRRAALGLGLVVVGQDVAVRPGTHAMPLAPLGSVGATLGGPKREGLSAEEVADILVDDLSRGQGYFVSGDLTAEIFDDRCRFVDPTNDVVGLKRYVNALAILFDTMESSVRDVELLEVADNKIVVGFTLGGVLKFPWRPKVERFHGTVTYTLGDSGLVVEQRQQWRDKSASKALRESFMPDFTLMNG